MTTMTTPPGLIAARDALLTDITNTFQSFERYLILAMRNADMAPGPLVSRIRELATVSEELAHVTDHLEHSGLLENSHLLPPLEVPKPEFDGVAVEAPELSLPYYEARLTELVGPFTEERYTELHGIARQLLDALMRKDASR